ncbi:MAG: hypothetical protein ACRD3W_08895, partial [Terriglobales bacterium]
MQQPGDIVNDKLKLLSSIELDEVAELAAQIVESRAQTQAVAVVIWDPDLESFADKYVFGARKKDLIKLADAFAEDSDPPKESIGELDGDDYKVNLPKELQPVFSMRLVREETLIGCILIAGTDCDENELSEILNEYPFDVALFNAWSHHELQRENNQLRSQYEEMEKNTTQLEDQTHNIIRELQVRDSLRYRHVERERLVYWISNVVRSSVHIQE